jgi:DNA-binding protein YbaB
MPLPTPEILAPGVAALERSLALLEASLLTNQFATASADGKVQATARGNVTLKSVTIAATEIPPPDTDATALAIKVLGVCGQALATASADSASRSATAAASYTLPGIPDALFPPPPDVVGFAGEVGNALAVSGALKRAIQTMQFEGLAGVARAIVDGTLELRRLEFSLPLPQTTEALETATVTAINIALEKAKQLFEEEIKDPVKKTGEGAPRPPMADPRPKALFLVETASALRPADDAIRARLVGLGFSVEAKPAPTSVAADGNGRTLIVISETVEPADVGSKFTGAKVPLIVCEPASLKDLKMTDVTQGTHYDSIFGQTKLQISTTHPLAAGLSGTITVTSAASKFIWGNPATSARKVGAIFGSTTRWGIFAYDTGDTMVGMNAPARRIGFFAGRDTAGSFTADGWRLFDAAVRWSTAARALLTVKVQPTAGSGDDLLKRRLEERHGLEVTIRLEGDTRTSDLGDMRVHVISESVTPGNIQGRYTSSAAPTVVCDANIFDDMKMTGATLNTDLGEVDAQSDLLIVAAAGDPLAAGLTGTVRVVASAQKFEWGKPGSEATTVAQLINRPTNFGVFGYHGGANMVGLRAPAPRVGFFPSNSAPAAFTPDGWALFDAAVQWARSPRVLLVVGAAARPDDEFLRKRLELSFGFIVEIKLAKDLVDQHSLGKHVIVISESVAPADVAAKLTSVAVPVVSLEPAVFKDLKMTDVASGDAGTATNQTELDLIKVDHPLAGGLTAGRVAVTTGPARFGWGRPASAAIKIARVVGSTDRWAVFGYETGATMVGRTAPARRVGCFVGEQTGPVLNDSGLRLFDAAVLWAAGRIEVRGNGGIGPTAGGTPPGGDPPKPPKQTWQVGVAYAIGDEVTHLGLDYRCRIAHTSQSDWEPQLTFNLWERINAGGVWTIQVLYKVGEEVSHQGIFYRCLQQHQSQPDWPPNLIPAVWQKIS